METVSVAVPDAAARAMHFASSRLLVRALPVFTILAALLFFSSQLGPLFQRGGGPAALPAPVAERGDLTRQEKATIELFRDAAPSVVHINTKEVRRSRFSLAMREIERGSGSGFVWDDDAYVTENPLLADIPSA